MKKKICGLAALAGMFSAAYAQFPPQAGTAGTTAIHKDSSVFVNWATGCTLNRGWMDVADTSLGKASVGDETYVPGKAANGVASLGDGGSAVMTFGKPVTNGPGFDFAVFENGFVDQTLAPGTAFLELAFVEVSSDGIHFERFDASSMNDTTKQLASFEGMDARRINNLAGKYTANYGTPFDLEELKDRPGLDVTRITHVRVIDVTGSIDPQHASRDAQGRKVNDPYPTPFASGGFDLDAVGVINEWNVNSVDKVALNARNIIIYPNPAAANADVLIRVPGKEVKINCYDLTGQEVKVRLTEDADGYPRVTFDTAGMYFISCTSGEERVTTRMVVQ